MPTGVAIDTTKATASFLRDHAELQAAIGRRVVVKTPSQVDDPWVRYTMLDQPKVPGGRTEHLTTALLQWDCYAGAHGGQPEAASIGYLIRHLLTSELPGSALDDGTVVTDVQVIGHMRMPDGDFEPERERVILTTQVVAHGT